MSRTLRTVAAIALFGACAWYFDAPVLEQAHAARDAAGFVSGALLLLALLAWPLTERIDQSRRRLRESAPLIWSVLLVLSFPLRETILSLVALPPVPQPHSSLLFGYGCIALALATLRTGPPSTRVDAIVGIAIALQSAVATAALHIGGHGGAAWLMALGGIFGVVVTIVRIARRLVPPRGGEPAGVRSRVWTRRRAGD